MRHVFLSVSLRLVRAGVVAGCAALLGGCETGGPQSALSPDGPAAAAIVDLWWVLLALSTFVVVLVIVTLVHGLWRRRDFPEEDTPLPISPDLAGKVRGERSSFEPTVGEDVPIEAQAGVAMGGLRAVRRETVASDRRSIRWVLAGGLVFPAVALTALYGFTMYTLGVVEARDEPVELTIEVVGWQFWWEVRYLDGEGQVLFETANEIHVPVGRTVLFRLEAADVIHSFWVPRLAGKMDMVPGKTNLIRIRADAPGTYRGQCAEYCGLQHAEMAFLVIAQSEAEFAAWLENQLRPAAEPTDSIGAFGREVFLSTACQACHAIRGTPAAGKKIGPDLTHLASRHTLAALALPNTRGHLGGWIASPQSLKPGSNMPAVPLGRDEFNALLHYLQTLR